MIHRNNGSHGANKPCTKGGHIVAYFSLALLGAIALGACAGETAPGKGSVAPAAPTVAPFAYGTPPHP